MLAGSDAWFRVHDSGVRVQGGADDPHGENAQKNVTVVSKGGIESVMGAMEAHGSSNGAFSGV
jgi:hypothetical protein